MSDTIGLNYTSMDTSQEVCDVFSSLKSERLKYFKNKIVYDALESCELKGDLKRKVDDIVMAHKLENCMSLDAANVGGNNIQLFGLSTLKTDEVSYVEMETVRKSVDQKIINTHQEVLKTLGPIIELNLTRTSLQHKIQHEFLQKLHYQQQMYVKNLTLLSDLMHALITNRTEKVPTLSNLKLGDAKIKERMYKLRTKILDRREQVNLFTETPVSLEAFRTVLGDLSEAQHELKWEIEELEGLKEKFRQVRCAEFDKVMKSYLSYKKGLEGLKDMYVKLNCD